MKLKGPFITLVAGVVVAGSLLGLSIAANNRSNTTDTTAANTAGIATATASAESAAPTATTPAPAGSAPAAAPDAVAAPVTFAGKVDGGAASIAIAVKQGKAIAYLCNGKNLESWLQGAAAAGKLSMNGKQQATLTATYDGAWVTGSVTVAGKPYSFRVKSVQAPSGLYRVANAQLIGGWIVDGDEQTGMVNGGQAPRINTITGEATVDGNTVRPAQVDGTTSLG